MSKIFLPSCRNNMLSDRKNTACLEMTALENPASNILGNGKWVWERNPRPQQDGSSCQAALVTSAECME